MYCIIHYISLFLNPYLFDIDSFNQSSSVCVLYPYISFAFSIMSCLSWLYRCCGSSFLLRTLAQSTNPCPIVSLMLGANALSLFTIFSYNTIARRSSIFPFSNCVFTSLVSLYVRCTTRDITCKLSLNEWMYCANS